MGTAGLKYRNEIPKSTDFIEKFLEKPKQKETPLLDTEFCSFVQSRAYLKANLWPYSTVSHQILPTFGNWIFN